MAYAKGAASGALRSIPGIGGAIGGMMDVRAARNVGGRRGHRHGISASDLKGFNRVIKLLKRVGMKPKGLGHARKAKR